MSNACVGVDEDFPAASRRFRASAGQHHVRRQAEELCRAGKRAAASPLTPLDRERNAAYADTKEKPMSVVAIVYWSGTGNTEAMADLIAQGVRAVRHS